MTTTYCVDRMELTADEIIDEIEAGNRVIIQVELLGRSIRMVLRHDAGTYYCDTPIRLFAFEAVDGMRDCLERFKLANAGDEEEPGLTETPVN